VFLLPYPLEQALQGWTHGDSCPFCIAVTAAIRAAAAGTIAAFKAFYANLSLLLLMQALQHFQHVLRLLRTCFGRLELRCGLLPVK
jgi:hypothetical protein